MLFINISIFCTGSENGICPEPTERNQACIWWNIAYKQVSACALLKIHWCHVLQRTNMFSALQMGVLTKAEGMARNKCACCTTKGYGFVHHSPFMPFCHWFLLYGWRLNPYCHTNLLHLSLLPVNPRALQSSCFPLQLQGYVKIDLRRVA